MRARTHALSALAVLTALLAPLAAQAQTIAPAQLLEQFKPKLKDVPVDYDTPTEKAEIDACKVDVKSDKASGTFAYLLRDGQGRLLRKFADTNGKKDSAGKTRLDQWSYYRDGFEVYREVDLNEDGVLDECRWMNAGGTRIATVKDNQVAGWRRLSAEESSKVLVQALVTGNAPLLETVMATPDELTGLGVPASQVEAARKAAEGRLPVVVEMRKGLKGWDGQTTWARFDGTLPHVIPADAGLKDDLLLYENAFIFVNSADPKADPMSIAYLQSIEMVRVGDTWKFVELPRVIDPAKPVSTTMEGGIRAALYENATSGAPGGAVDPATEKALKALADHDQTAPGPDATRQDLAKFHVDRVNLLFAVIKSATTPEDRLNFTKQAVDSLSAAYQTGLYPAAAERLTQYAGQTGAIASYAAYRKAFAEYGLDSDQPGAEFIKVQKAYLEKLAAFLEKFPASEETPDVLFQLASINEFNAEEDAARKYYERLVKDFAGSQTGKKAAGALTRLDLVGKPLAVSGTAVDGKTVSSEQFGGKTLLVAYFATTADRTRRDLPELADVLAKYRSKGFEVLGVSLDADRASLDAFLKESPLPFPVLNEPGGMDSPLADQYGIISLPTMILVGKDGKVVNRNIRTAAELDRFLETLLTNPEAASRPTSATR
jgi:peroxiredoxin/TolA-binding protein